MSAAKQKTFIRPFVCDIINVMKNDTSRAALQGSQKRKKHKMLKAALIILGALLIALWADSNFRLVTTRYEIASDKIPPEFDGYTIVQLSDVHGRQYGEDNAKLLELVALQNPDVIAVTGDLIDRYPNLKNAEALIAGLVKIAPVYYITGNHEWDSGKTAELFEILESYGAYIMHDEYVLLQEDDAYIILAGVQDPNSWEIRMSPEALMSAVTEAYPNAYRILLAHRSGYDKAYPQLETDLIICGHAHGGIIRLPFIGGLLGTRRNLFPDDEDSSIGEGSYDIIVSHGLGDSVVYPRLFNNPELVVIKLRSK